MRTLGVSLLALGAGLAMTSAPAIAKGKAKKGGGDDAPPPSASSAEVNKLKAVRLGDPKGGTFKWGMKPEEVLTLAKNTVAAKYQARIKAASQDPGKQQRIHDEMDRETKALTKSYLKFEGQKSGWDVSIVDKEFQQNTGEAMIVVKEDVWTRYFFFFEDGLYKMFLAFNKDAIEGKSFKDFGADMEHKYGRAKEVYRDEKVRGGMRHVLDHFEWGAASDRLRLVDRSEFYDVYCLVLYDGNTASRLAERRKVVNPGTVQKDELVEAVVQRGNNERDSNDDIIDRVTGHETRKPGEEDKHGNITVPSPGKGSSTAVSDEPARIPSSQPEKEAPAKKEKPSKGKKNDALDGLEL
jgi:hypothetical protein